MNPTDRAWFERIGINLTRTEGRRYVTCIEPPAEDTTEGAEATAGQEVEA